MMMILMMIIMMIMIMIMIMIIIITIIMIMIIIIIIIPILFVFLLFLFAHTHALHTYIAYYAVLPGFVASDFAERRKKLAQQLSDDSVAIVFGAEKTIMSNDIPYVCYLCAVRFSFVQHFFAIFIYLFVHTRIYIQDLLIHS